MKCCGEVAGSLDPTASLDLVWRAVASWAGPTGPMLRTTDDILMTYIYVFRLGRDEVNTQKPTVDH